MNIFEEEGFVDNVINAQEYESCLLCKKKYKQEKATPVGKECEKKMKKQYNFAVINVASGCNECPDVFTEKKDLHKYFGTSVDIIIATSMWGGFTCEWLWKDGHFHYWEESWGEDDSLYEDKTPDELELIMALTGKTNAELVMVHEDMWGLSVVQHGHYMGPCKSWDEFVQREGCTPHASCYCGRYYEDIREELDELESELARYEKLSMKMRFSLIDEVKNDMAQAEVEQAEKMSDVRLGLSDMTEQGQFGILDGTDEQLWFAYKRLEEKPIKMLLADNYEELGATIELVH